MSVADFNFRSLEPYSPVVHPCPSEKDVQAKIVSIACGNRHSPGLGFVHYTSSQYRASHVSVGWPDLKLYHEGQRLGLWWETKTYDAKEWKAGRRALKPLSPAQEVFRRLALAADERHGWGAVPEFYEMLHSLGFAEIHPSGVLSLRSKW